MKITLATFIAFLIYWLHPGSVIWTWLFSYTITPGSLTKIFVKPIGREPSEHLQLTISRRLRLV